MTVRALVVARKTLEDFSRPRFLLLFLVPYIGITALIALGVAGTVPEDVATLPLATQRGHLLGAYVTMAFLWSTGVPIMGLVAVLVANGVAKEEERGSMRILLSKPITRRSVLGGKVLGVIAACILATLAGLLVGAALVVLTTGVDPNAAGAPLAIFPGTLLYATLLSLALVGLGSLVATTSVNRLRTGLVVGLVPGLFFAFIPIRRITQGSGQYGDYFLYLADVNYHLGNTFVVCNRLFGTTFDPGIQSTMAFTTGVYDVSAAGVDPLLGAMPASVPLAGYLPPIASFLLVVAVGVGSLGLTFRHFGTKDIE